MSTVVAKRYAQAFFELTEEAGVSEIVQLYMSALDDLHRSSAEFRRLMTNPVITIAEKQRLLDLTLQAKVHAQTLNFLHFLADKQRLDWLPLITSAYMEMCFDRQGLLPATIESNVTLSKTQVEKISERFQQLTGKKIQPDIQVKAEMLGGFKVKINNMIFDHTVEAKLRKFKHSIIND
ncbi:MAG: ATP synthase F1 subunit delta [Bacteroidales bacterium]|nr:ATP synthase F1 subunit delta [Bacteroidales bacterium]